MEVNMENPKKQNLFERIIHDPVSLISISIGIIGIVVAIVIPLNMRETRGLVYAINPIKTQIVSTGKTSGLDIFFNGEQLGDVDITAMQVALWNSGDLSIKQENILKEIVIYTEPQVYILETSIIKSVKDNEVSKFVINDSEENLNLGRIPVTWKILEKNDGASIQIIYVGNNDVQIAVAGYIEDYGEIQKSEYEHELDWELFLMIGILAFIVVLFSILIKAKRSVRIETKRLVSMEKRLFITIIVILLFVIAFSLYGYFNQTSYAAGSVLSPFGF